MKFVIWRKENVASYINDILQITSNLPSGHLPAQVNKRNTRTRCEISSKLPIKTPEQYQASFWCRYC